jgi:tetratricopeptide (TPR) repeat protein
VEDACKQCGRVLVDGESAYCRKHEPFRIVHRDLVLLLMLSLVAVGGFLFTRFIAAQDKRAEDRVGEIWYQQGEELVAAQQYEAAIDSFRKARARDRDKKEYVLALASALQSANHFDEARQALLHIRELAPENAEINLSLARLAARRRDVTEASRYYHNALYGLWTGTQVDKQRREVRVELVNFLLDHQQRSMALSELLVLDTELPDDAKDYDAAGELYLRAGDPAHALKDFTRAVHLDRKDGQALAGAGQAAFETHDFALARHYLQGASAVEAPSPATRQTLAVVNSIFSQDPLLPHISREERIRRTIENYEKSMASLQQCVSRHNTAETPTPELDPLHAEALAFRDRLKPKTLQKDPEAIRDAVDLIYRIEHTIDASCGPVQGSDKALLLIGRKHIGTLQ